MSKLDKIFTQLYNASCKYHDGDESAYDGVLAAQDEIREMGPQWQPIETAPTDGTTILTYHPSGYIVTISWQGQALGWGCSAHGDICGMYGFSRWLELPEPPEN